MNWRYREKYTERRPLFALAVLASLTAVLGCGAPDNRGVVVGAVAQSPVVNETPIVFSDLSGRVAPLTWELVGGTGTLKVGFGPAERTFDMPGSEQVLVVRPWHVGATDYVLIGSIDASGVWSLRAVTDVDGDGAVDESTATVLFSTGTTPAYISEFRSRGSSDDVYLLDRRCQDIWLARDTDSDGLPDTLQPSPFARSADYPELLTAETLYFAKSNWVDFLAVGESWGNANAHFRHRHRGDIRRLVDTDSDGSADLLTTYRAANSAPHTYGKVHDGQTTVKVGGTATQAAEVWSMKLAQYGDADGEVPDQLLGSVTCTGGEGWDSLVLARALVEGERVRVNYANLTDRGFVTRVTGDWPQIIDSSRSSLSTAGASLVLTGVNFAPGMTVRLRTGAQYLTSMVLPHTLDSSEQITVTYGALASGLVGRAMLELVGPDNEDPNDRRSAIPVPVCLPSGS